MTLWNKIETGGEFNKQWNGKDSNLKIGDEVCGEYLDRKDDVGVNKSKVYTIKTKDECLDVWGSTILDDQMKDIPVGSEIKIVFSGEGISKARKKPYKIYEVYVAAEPENQ